MIYIIISFLIIFACSTITTFFTKIYYFKIILLYLSNQQMFETNNLDILNN